VKFSRRDFIATAAITSAALSVEGLTPNVLAQEEKTK
jgi:hypothetical protein